MIKVLFFIENLHDGGAERVLRNLVNTMDQKRFEITVQTLWPGNAEQLLCPGIHYKTCYRRKTRFTNMLSRIEAWLGLTYRFRIRDDYDIECAYLECFSTKIIASSTNRRARKLAWVHCDLQKKMKQMRDPQKFKVVAKKWYKQYDKIICVSEDVRDSFVALFGDAEKTAVLYNTVDDEAIRRKAEDLPPDMPPKRRFTAVAVGRLSAEKQYDMLLRVHERLLDEGIGHDLWIVGEGAQRSRLEAYMTENHLQDSVALLGFRANPYPYMKAADLLICSSRYEGFSTFITEGLILGKPAVTTDCSGMRELLGDSQYGLVTDNSEDALYDGMKRLLLDSSLLESYAARAAARGKAFSAKRLTENTEQYFLSILKDDKL